MPGVEDLLPFVLAALVLSITPGPGVLYIAAQTVARGRSAGWRSALGTHLASYLHIAAAAFGAALLLTAAPLALLVMKSVGAMYLMWLGVRILWFETLDARSPSHSEGRRRPSALRESFVVELTNPKSALFFLAFLPQFTDPAIAAPIWAQIILLGTIANLIFTATELACVIFADQVAACLRSGRVAGRWMKRMAGGVMIALGVKLLATEP